MATVVIDLQDRRPIWSLPQWAREAIGAAVPDGWSVEFIAEAADGSGDGVHRTPVEVLEAVGDARVYMGYGIPPEVLEAGPLLEWVHSGAAGVGSSLTPAMLQRDIRFTNSAGIHGPPMAETVLGMMLYFVRGFDIAVRAQSEGRWGAEEFWAGDSPVGELAGSKVGVIGYGGIGQEVARRAAAFGARVRGVRRRPRGTEEHPVVGMGDLDQVLAESDFVVVTAPDTAETRGLLDRGRLLAMKPGSVLINVARGKLVDSDAVLEALDTGPLRGAGLDVFHTEPLPAEHPFYGHPRVLMTPHVSATTRRFWERESDLIRENLGRFHRGEPLVNEVDKARGY